jgi:subtilisin family serine protease
MSVVKFDKRLKSILSRGEGPEKSSGMSRKAEEGNSARPMLSWKRHLRARTADTLSEETNIPPIDVFKLNPDEELMQLLPENLASYYGAIPAAKVGNFLTLAVSNPFDILKFDDIQIVTGCDVPVLSTDVSIKKAIPEIYNKGSRECRTSWRTWTAPRWRSRRKGAVRGHETRRPKDTDQARW